MVTAFEKRCRGQLSSLLYKKWKNLETRNLRQTQNSIDRSRTTELCFILSSLFVSVSRSVCSCEPKKGWKTMTLTRAFLHYYVHCCATCTQVATCCVRFVFIHALLTSANSNHSLPTNWSVTFLQSYHSLGAVDFPKYQYYSNRCNTHQNPILRSIPINAWPPLPSARH